MTYTIHRRCTHTSADRQTQGCIAVTYYLRRPGRQSEAHAHPRTHAAAPTHQHSDPHTGTARARRQTDRHKGASRRRTACAVRDAIPRHTRTRARTHKFNRRMLATWLLYTTPHTHYTGQVYISCSVSDETTVLNCDIGALHCESASLSCLLLSCGIDVSEGDLRIVDDGKVIW
eukprot:COSAG01_NODE_18627_length_1063_cov_2.255187_1_plen_174_part_00